MSRRPDSNWNAVRVEEIDVNNIVQMETVQEQPRRASKGLFRGLGAALLLTTVACGNPFGVEDRERIQAQKAIWESQALDDYTFETRLRCFCAFVEWVEVTVEADTVVSVAPLESTDVPAWLLENHPTIDDLFTTLEEAVDQNAVQIDVSWHETLGYPTTFFIDYQLNVADEELGQEVRVLTPTP
ncbi:MAG: DUF6174 domain-containing protein [Longimicrobiales bacterium]